jgi:hypothetical protein
MWHSPATTDVLAALLQHNLLMLEANRSRPSRAQAAKLLIAGFGVVLVGIAVWGVWISAGVGGFVPATRPGDHSLSTAVSVLTWLVFFGPFFYFGAALLYSAFAPEDRNWLVPLRWFSVVVALRTIADAKRQSSVNAAAGKLPLAEDVPRRLPAPKDSTRSGEGHQR